MAEGDRSVWPKALTQVLEKGKSAIDNYVDDLYKKTTLTDPEKRLQMLNMKKKALMKLNDPFVNLAAELELELKELRKKSRILSQEIKDLKKVYLAGVLEMKKGKRAPDANSSMRFSYGNVKGYQFRDAVYYKPFTTLTGLMEKNRGKEPFNVPEKLQNLYKKKDYGRYLDKKNNDVVVCFMDTGIATGGSSGSPVFNARGEQVGIHFDRPYETVISDYYLFPETQRSIRVDIRYVIFITDKFARATHLLKEMGL